MRGWYFVYSGEVVKLVHVGDDGRDEVRKVVPSDLTLGQAMDLVFDLGEVRDGDLLIWVDGSQVRLGSTEGLPLRVR